LSALPKTASEKKTDPDVVLYDGECRFCQRQIDRLRRLDVGRKLAFLSLHSSEVEERYPDISREQLMSEMAIVTRQGTRHFGASALRYLTRKLPTLWLLAPLLHLPGSLPLWSWLYGHVARRRYLFGRLETCEEGVCDTHVK
jgi:predicted DCC family thiol-disulfide oxidoreductase YuxK